MTEPPSAAARDRPTVPMPPTGPTPVAPAPTRALPEPPAFRGPALGAAGACVNCGTGLESGRTAPRCWECGRTLCADCYWRHGLSPTDHRCAACTARGPLPPTSISGGRITTPPFP